MVEGTQGALCKRGQGLSLCWSQLLRTSSVMGGTNSLHPNAAASQRGPGPPAPPELEEGESAGAWEGYMGSQEGRNKQEI